VILSAVQNVLRKLKDTWKTNRIGQSLCVEEDLKPGVELKAE